MGRAARALLAGLTALALCAGGAAAQDNPVEYGVKGAYLYKFLPFVGWPAAALPSPNAPLTICILGHDPFGPVLDKAVADQHVDARAIAVRRVETVDAGCQVVFVGIADPQAEGAALQALQGKPVLTVTDSGAPAPGIIAFAIEANHVRFDIDDAAAARNGLTISSKLLSLAHAVKLRSSAL
ncbi:MAG TPA: YfiR family protein [Rhizomicrobium sp.]|jgi:hypothetical protein|nr:YfiR family protein [Rhizomicrobium sp.]